ncbi:porin family protein [Photobacterium leiognathi subsp. mandapamensis]|nr:porin family protein [Photobacterium leiognathi subsp. mandapamensis]
MKKLLLATLVCSLSSTYAVASENTTNSNKYQGFYVGAGVGTTDFHDDFESELKNDPTTHLSYDDDSKSYKIIAGYQFNRIVSLEAQYTKYGDVKYFFKKGSYSESGKAQHESFSIAANLGYTFDNGLRPFATVGLGSISLKQNEFKDDGGLIRLGAGLEYQVKQVPGLGIRVAYEADFYTLETAVKDYDQTIGSWYLGTTYKF